MRISGDKRSPSPIIIIIIIDVAPISLRTLPSVRKKGIQFERTHNKFWYSCTFGASPSVLGCVGVPFTSLDRIGVVRLVRKKYEVH
jgi:hypothetical protein